MTETPRNFDKKALLASLSLSIVVDTDKIFDVLPEVESDLIPLAGPTDEQWRAIFLGPPGITAVARLAPFATLSGVHPDGPDESHADMPGMPPIPPSRDWAVMTFGFKTRRAAAVAGMAWAIALVKPEGLTPGDGGLAFVGVAAFPPDWRGYA